MKMYNSRNRGICRHVNLFCLLAFQILIGVSFCYGADQYYILQSSSSDTDATTAYTNSSANSYVEQYASASSSMANPSGQSAVLTASGSAWSFAVCQDGSGENPTTTATAHGSASWSRDSQHDDDSPRQVEISFDVSGSVWSLTLIGSTDDAWASALGKAHAEAYAGSTETGTSKSTVEINNGNGNPTPYPDGCASTYNVSSQCGLSYLSIDYLSYDGCQGYADFTISCNVSYYPTSKNLTANAQVFAEADLNLDTVIFTEGSAEAYGKSLAEAYGTITISPH